MEYIWTENTKRNTIWTMGGEKEKRHEDEEKKRGWKNRNVFSFVSLQTGCVLDEEWINETSLSKVG